MKNIFLLGGYDLEMLTIRELLDAHQQLYFDKQLRWDNANLSAYSSELAEYGNQVDITIYGIELHEQSLSEIPANYQRIDHHNDYTDRPSALEQIAHMLHIPLSRHQQLVAANDSGYIPAMVKAGASQEEIDDIRRQDRKTQGVTEEDEQLAEQAIKEKTMMEDVIVVKAYSTRFSPICDRLYPYKRLLIYTDEELMYYGEGKKFVAEAFFDETRKGKIFHGGGDSGYIGTAKGSYEKKEIINLLTEFTQIVTTK